MQKRIIWSFLALLLGYSATAQKQEPEDGKLIQFSGLLVTDDGKGLAPVPYATIFLPDKKRGTYSKH